jgi:hypothetical protein
MVRPSNLDRARAWLAEHMRYMPSDLTNLEKLLENVRQDALTDAAESFSSLNWLCLDHGGEELVKIRETLYALRDRKTR